MKAFLLILACVSTVYGTAFDRRSERRRWASAKIGGPHGDAFDDFSAINRPGMQDHRRISAITLHGCDVGEHVTQMDISYKDRIGYGPEPLIKHGGKHAKPVKSSLLFEIADGEYITEVIITTWKTWTGKVMDTYHTRIGSMKIITNLHRYIQCGSDFDHDPKSVLVPKKGGALLYFSGAAGSAIDNLQAHWIPVEDF